MADDRQTTAPTTRQRTSASLTAAVLDPRSGDGWWVLHDVAVPGADHVVVTPGAVWVVASTPGEPSAAEVEALTVGAATVERSLATSAVGLMAPVLPVMCVTAPVTPDAHALGVVAVVGLPSLLRLLAGVAAVFTPLEVAHITEIVDESFVNRRGAGSSVVRPAPEPPASTDLPVLHPSGRVIYGASDPRGGTCDEVYDLRVRSAVSRRAALVAAAAGALGMVAASLAELLAR